MATVHWRGRRSGSDRDGGDDATTASPAGEMRRKRLGMRGLYVAIFFTTLLPSLVAGQSMACNSGFSNGQYVAYSADTAAQLNGIAGDLATFTEYVRLSSSLHPSFILY